MAIGSFISDLLGPSVSTYLTPALEGAATGAIGSLAQGKNPLTGALVGGGTGLGIGAFGGADGALAQALGLSGPQVNALIGGAGGALGYGLTGQNPLIGGGLGALGGYMYGNSAQGQDPYTQGGETKEGGGGTGWTDASSGKAVDSTGNTYGGATASGKGGGPLGAVASGILGSGDGTGGISKTQLLLGALAALGSATSKPKQGTWATPGPASNAANLGPTFNAPLNTNVPGRTAVNPFASPTPSYWTYGGPERTYFSGNSLKSYGFADGGAMSSGVEGGQEEVDDDDAPEFSTSSGQHYVQGPGDGKEDLIPAQLADGEYVLDATTVSRIGNGSNRRGAEKIDQWRKNVAKAAGSDTVVQKTVNPGALMAALGGAV